MNRVTALFLLLFSSLPAWGEVVDQIAALAEGEVVTLSEVRQLVQYKGWQVSTEPDRRRDFYLMVLDQIINQKLISREAQQTPGIQITEDDVGQQLRAYRRRFASPEGFQQQLNSMEMTETTLRDLIRRELTVWKFFQIRFEPFVIVMPHQIQKYYDEILVPELARTGAPLPALELVREQIREILILEKTNQEMDRWVKNMRGKARVSVLLFRENPFSPNLPREILTEWELQPITIEPADQ